MAGGCLPGQCAVFQKAVIAPPFRGQGVASPGQCAVSPQQCAVNRSRKAAIVPVACSRDHRSPATNARYASS